jgi:hypothetical protein
MWILLHADNLRIMGQSSESPERNWEANRMPAEFLQRGIEVGEWGEHLPQEMRKLAARIAQPEAPTSPMLPPCPPQPVQSITTGRSLARTSPSAVASRASILRLLIPAVAFTRYLEFAKPLKI